MGQESYHAVTLVDLKNPVPPEWLQKAGIDYVYAGGGIPLETGPDGEPVVASESREDWERVFQLYRGTGVKVLLMSQFYTRPPEGTEAVDFFGRSHKMACFRQQDFLDWMRETIVHLATAFGKYEAFGGFAFDDGVHVRVDCCYCDACRRLFNEQHGIEPPPFEHHRGTARVPDDHPLLLWEQFQRESFEIYLRTQSEAVRSVSEDLLMVTIPSDAYYFGRFLNVDVAPDQSSLGAGALLQRIERIQLRNWYTFYTFPLARLPETTERGLQPWAAGTHITAQSARIIIQTEGPFLPLYGRIQYMSPTEIERMARVTVAEGAGGICFWSPGDKLPHYPAAFDGIAAAYRDIASIEELLASRRRLPASVGLLYSTTTEVFEQPWTTNTSQRWQHLHAFEGLAYSLLRANLPFDVVMEDDLTPERLSQLDALVLPAARFMTESAARALEAAVAAGELRAIAAGPHPPLKGVIEAPCDPLIWHRWASQGYRQEEHLNEQWREVALHLVPLIRPAVGASVQVFSERVVSRLYRLEGGDLLVMIASWDLRDPADVVVEGRGRASDVFTGEELGKLEEGRAITVLPAGWRVLRVAQQR